MKVFKFILKNENDHSLQVLALELFKLIGMERLFESPSWLSSWHIFPADFQFQPIQT